MQIRARADRRDEHLELAARRERRLLPGEDEPGAACPNRRRIVADCEQPSPRDHVQQRVVSLLPDRRGHASPERQRPQRERRAVERADVEWVVHEAGM